MEQHHNGEVFINCPFDEEYKAIFEAILFTVYRCGYKPRCAKEFDDSSDYRNSGILDLIKQCRLGIHDLSRKELNKHNLPRFNMPLELGYFIGAKYFGSSSQKNKKCLILDEELYDYKEFISDIGGQDIKAHNRNPNVAAKCVRNWLNASHELPLPGAMKIQHDLEQFYDEKPDLLKSFAIRDGEEDYHDVTHIMQLWILTNS